MRIGMLGSGIVGQTLASRLVQLGHDVMMGTRDAGKLAAWVATTGGKGRVGSPSEAAAHAEVVFNATKGNASVAILEAIGPAALDGKILVDVANPLEFLPGKPPTLFVKDSDSLGEQIQRALPGTRVVKTLNTTNAAVMADPTRVGGGDHSVFISGNDPAAKATVTELLRSFGWRDIIDLGDLTTARGAEMLLPIWIRLMQTLNTPAFNFKIVR